MNPSHQEERLPAIDYREAVNLILKRNEASVKTARKSNMLEVAKLNVDFKSYEEAWHFFNSINEMQINRNTNTDGYLNTNLQTNLETLMSEITDPASGWQETLSTFNYEARPYITTTASNSFGLFSFGVDFDWKGKVEYFSPAVIRRNAVSNTQLYYSGAGTMSLYLTQLANLVRSDGDDKLTGKIQGLVQITGTIVNTPFSAYAVLIGGYNIIIPVYSSDPLYVKVWLKANMN